MDTVISAEDVYFFSKKNIRLNTIVSTEFVDVPISNHCLHHVFLEASLYQIRYEVPTRALMYIFRPSRCRDLEPLNIVFSSGHCFVCRYLIAKFTKMYFSLKFLNFLFFLVDLYELDGDNELGLCGLGTRRAH